MTGQPIEGHVTPGFEPVLEAFQATFAAGEELGAGFCALVEGEVVVDLQGGWADGARQRAWIADTIVPVFSTTKAVAALVVARAIGESGGTVSYDTPVAEVWPDFAANGKAAVTLGEVLSHQAGLVGFVEEIDPDLWLDPPALSAQLATLAPMWTPGTAHGYHPLTWGYMAGEICRRMTGRSLGTILREDICGPAEVDFAIGLPERDHGRVVEMQRPKALPAMGPLTGDKRAAFLTRWAAPKRGGKVWKEIEIPSANGHGTARAVARLYGIYAQRGVLHGLSGPQQVVPEPMFAELVASRTIGEDRVLPFVTEFAAGVMRNNLGLYGPNPDTLAHSGWGGSMGLGDPDRGVSAAYVMNRQSSHLQGDPRARRLVDALYSCL
ncbi:MAG: serine hydrolase domain-containing protein [Pseudomonadota bacterium]